PGGSPSPLTAYFAELEGVDGVSASFEYHFALGVGYLDEFTLDLENTLVLPCWVGALDDGPNGEFEVESVVVEGSSATIETSGLDHFALSLHDTGVTTATVEGVFHPTDPDSCEFAFAQEIDDGLRFS